MWQSFDSRKFFKTNNRGRIPQIKLFPQDYQNWIQFGEVFTMIYLLFQMIAAETEADAKCTIILICYEMITFLGIAKGKYDALVQYSIFLLIKSCLNLNSCIAGKNLILNGFLLAFNCPLLTICYIQVCCAAEKAMLDAYLAEDAPADGEENNRAKISEDKP